MDRDTILVVEDDSDVRGALVALLEGAGYATVEAEHGGEALRLLRNTSTGSTSKVCLILLDLFMPEMNGWAFRTEQLNDPELAAIPVVVITADPGAAKRAMIPGVVASLTKPVEFDQLLRIVQRHC